MQDNFSQSLMRTMSFIDSRAMGVVAAAVMFFGFYSLMSDMEQKHSHLRIHWLGAALYAVGGNLLLSGVIGLVFGLIVWALWPSRSLD